MKRGLDSQIIFNNKKEPKGVYLGADFYAEHECGIGRLKEALGIDYQQPVKHFWNKPVSVYGADKRKITKNDNVRFGNIHYKKHDYIYVITSDTMPIYGEDSSEIIATGYLNDYGAQKNLADTGVAAFWQDNAFLIIFDAKLDFAKEFINAFQNCDIILYFSKGEGIFSNSGLTITVLSREDESLLNEFEHADKSQEKLELAVQETHIHDILRKAGKKYLALTPKWEDENQTKIHFWLNPMDQRNNNYGWYSLEELIEWSQNKGPIVKA